MCYCPYSLPPFLTLCEVFRYRVEQQPVAGSLSWRRRVLTAGPGGGLAEHWQRETRALLFLSGAQLAARVAARTLEVLRVSDNNLIIICDAGMA